MSWNIPKKVSDVTLAFPASIVGEYLPEMKDIPEEFKKHGNKWAKDVSELFYNGGTIDNLKSDISKEDATRHMVVMLSSFEPKHEHKIAGAAWLLSMWSEK